MLRFSTTKVEKEKFYSSAKKPIKISHVNVDNIVLPKLVHTKNSSIDRLDLIWLDI